jgi:CBS domain-containing protein
MQRDITVREVMDDAFVGVSESDELLEASELLLADGSPVAVVLEGSAVVGGMTARDVLELVVDGGDPASATIGDVMTDAVHTIRPDRSLAEARDEMTSRSTPWLVVTDGDDPVGVVTERDLLAGSTLGSEVTSEQPEESAEGVGASAVGAATGTETATNDAFEDQGICEVCGSLTHDLAAFNGQLRCADCRNV